MRTSNFYLFIMIFVFACGGGRGETEKRSDTTEIKESDNGARSGKVYSNARFRNVAVAKVGTDRFTVTGQGQIFEANFGWVVEDGHQELKNGFEMTDAGAPAWGNFKFGIEVQKQRPNSTLTLVLYESSAKDGSRQHELAIPLD